MRKQFFTQNANTRAFFIWKEIKKCSKIVNSLIYPSILKSKKNRVICSLPCKVEREKKIKFRSHLWEVLKVKRKAVWGSTKLRGSYAWDVSKTLYIVFMDLSLFPFLYPTIVYWSFIIGYLCESSVAMCLENNCKSVFTSTRSQKENQLQGLHGYFWERVTPLYIVID